MRLPPPPANPVRPPCVRLAGEQRISLTTRDGLCLEAMARLPARATRAVLLCHPHPLYGGTMHNAVVIAVTRELLRGGDDVATLRFNFRGVEGSEGKHAGGEGECVDAAAALDALLRALPGTPVSLMGYSFGSWVATQLAWRRHEVERVALVAPALGLFRWEPERERPLHCEVLVGDRDEFVTVAEARALTGRIGARLHVIDGADHFFVGQRRLVARTLWAFLSPQQAVGR